MLNAEQYKNIAMQTLSGNVINNCVSELERSLTSDASKGRLSTTYIVYNVSEALVEHLATVLNDNGYDFTCERGIDMDERRHYHRFIISPQGLYSVQTKSNTKCLT